MRKFMTKKVGIIFAGVLATMLAAGAAFAYWTAGGLVVPLPRNHVRSTPSDQHRPNGAGVRRSAQRRDVRNEHDGPCTST
jgi:hypothetical protein